MLLLDEVAASDPQMGYSAERKRGWDEAVATVRSLARKAALAPAAPADTVSGNRAGWHPDRCPRCGRTAGDVHHPDCAQAAPAGKATKKRCDDDFFCGECEDCLSNLDPENNARADR